jgi:hypothetical protein
VTRLTNYVDIVAGTMSPVTLVLTADNKRLVQTVHTCGLRLYSTKTRAFGAMWATYDTILWIELLKTALTARKSSLPNNKGLLSTIGLPVSVLKQSVSIKKYFGILRHYRFFHEKGSGYRGRSSWYFQCHNPIILRMPDNVWKCIQTDYLMEQGCSYLFKFSDDIAAI